MNTEFLIRLVVAALLGAAIGFEREWHAKEAGIRTHLLVSLGSCMFMIISIYGFEGFYDKAHTSFDPSRIAAQVVTGIGFLGAGTIIFHKNIIRGLTTAAGLWVTSAIGLACGNGMYILATMATLSVLLSLVIMNAYLKRFGTRHISVSFVTDTQQSVNMILKRLRKDNIEVKDYSMTEDSIGTKEVLKVSLSIKTKRYKYKTFVSEIIKEFEGVNVTVVE